MPVRPRDRQTQPERKEQQQQQKQHWCLVDAVGPTCGEAVEPGAPSELDADPEVAPGEEVDVGRAPRQLPGVRSHPLHNPQQPLRRPFTRMSRGERRPPSLLGPLIVLLLLLLVLFNRRPKHRSLGLCSRDGCLRCGRGSLVEGPVQPAHEAEDPVGLRSSARMTRSCRLRVLLAVDGVAVAVTGDEPQEHLVHGGSSLLFGGAAMVPGEMAETEGQGEL